MALLPYSVKYTTGAGSGSNDAYNISVIVKLTDGHFNKVMAGAKAYADEHDNVKVDIDVSEKLSPSAPLETQFSMEQDLKDGKVYAREYGKDIPGQMTFKDYDNNQEEVDGKIVDTETGEIVEDKNIVDFRQAK